MAFRKRVGIAKGLHLNFSGNGAGVGLRLFPGLSISANRNGLYCNSSVPGTGFYSRNKIGGWGSQQPDSDETKARLTEVDADAPESPDKTYFEFNGEATVDNEVVISITRDGRPITELELATLKKFDGYKESINTVHRKVAQRVQDETDEVVDIYKLTASPIAEEELQSALANLQLETFVPQHYDRQEPTTNDVRTKLEVKAQKEINSILFWTNSSRRKAYVEEHLDEAVRKARAEWASAKEKFEKAEAERERSEKERCTKEYEEKKAALEGAISGNTAYVENQIETLLSNIQLPVDFAISYEYSQENSLLMVQLDLPEIEDFPSRKATILASGKASIKAKTKYELNADYSVGVCGLAFFFAGMLFNVSTNIKHIAINGYTQRVNGANGQTEDQYVYSVLLNRKQFAQMRFESIDPIEALEAYPHRMNMLKTAEMKSVEPFKSEDVIEVICNN